MAENIFFRNGKIYFTNVSALAVDCATDHAMPAGIAPSLSLLCSLARSVVSVSLYVAGCFVEIGADGV